MHRMVNADPFDYLGSSDPSARTCEACGSSSLTSGRLSTAEPVDMFACDACGDFWFERHGTRLTANSMRELGLLQG